ncbi:DEAD/DEAH box helicase family protein [Iamia sp. SCSIO 61187]|uniref:DEAD/DEAH box helicase family protein n=1 Tax=Iamia sp. SCSIO 61187 TaxID=2722752 RepID=UPI001C636A9B|nr:DEAD/DEAH box helicase family protein [Iamia sp. SCSIO 61187]QYG94376.1 DEAD/DEAH box helicase family protein [Iamia sp. SCSIO 61187]
MGACPAEHVERPLHLGRGCPGHVGRRDKVGLQRREGSRTRVRIGSAFLGLAPSDASLVGIELDPTTAEIARHLYGARATVHHSGFEDFRGADGAFDLVIGNVPFGQVRPHDLEHNRGRRSLHNYFLIKSLHLVRPGGFVVALTSRYTLDAQGCAAREEMAALADLVGAARLPARAFAESSGTEVVVDLLVLRRRQEGDEPVSEEWVQTVPADLTGEGATSDLRINSYFASHPDRILGQLSATRGMYRENEITVTATGPVVGHLTVALDQIVADALAQGRGFGGDNVTACSPRAADTPGGGDFDTRWAQDGSLVVNPRGRVGQVTDGHAHLYAPRFAKDRGELVRLVGLRDAARAVLDVQVEGGSDQALAEAQAVLTDRYRAYVRQHGPLNRSSQARTGRRDAETGAEVLRRVRPRMGGFRMDPDWPLVAALEDFDQATQEARPAAIFTERVIAPPSQREGVETPAEAVSVCLDETGTVTLGRVARLLGVEDSEARERLGELVFDDPDTGELIPAALYLSGNIRHRVEAARAAAETDQRFAVNVAALEASLPRQLDPSEITARPGATWIPSTDVEAFCREVLDVGVDVERLAELGSWTVRLRDGSRRGVALTSEWGTSRADALVLLDAALNQRLHTVTDAVEGGRRVRNDAETLAARDKQELLASRFSTWIWEDPARSARLADRYNELFASTLLPHHDGSHLTFPGLAETFTPRPHQRDAVARILSDGRALLAHAVGAGKTATIVMAAMEQRRLGLANKPAVVVPNHMLEQFSREWLQLYPTARLLIADREHLSKDRRKEFVARAATGDWDAVIFSHSGFARIPLGTDLLRAYLGEEIDTAREALGQSKGGKGLSVKKLERRIAKMEEVYKRLLAEESKDDGVRFEETGIDYLYVDEAHAHKNRRVDSSIDGVATTGSQRAQDLTAKLWALRRDHGPKVVTLSTATPVANSMAELWVMQSYLHPDLLEEVGLRAFDAWAATFGRTHTALELSPDGSSYRMQTRFARFQNVPELLGLYRQVADVRTAEDLGLPVPAIVGGKPETVVVEPSDELIEYVADLAARAERVRAAAVDPSKDNMLKVTGDGRRAALDLRLVDLDQPYGGKVAAAAQRVAALHHATADRTYEGPDGQLTMRPGALQLVFCDVSTPAAAGWNAYDDLRAQLVRRGVPADTIRFIQEAKSDDAKAALFAACRDGSVSVLVGSTETMGVGTNVQNRVVAVHHLDAPWRPADVEQRDGRGVRQGNQNPEIHITRYVTERSFDTYLWHTLERKAAFIGQVTRGDLGEREVEDIGDQTLSFQEVKALATGDPLILEKAKVDSEVARLTRLERAHHDDQRNLRRTHDSATARADHLDGRIADLEAAVARLENTRGDRFAMTVDGHVHRERPDAGEHVHRLVADRLVPGASPSDERIDWPVGHLGGHEVRGRRLAYGADAEVRLSVPGTPVDLVYLVSEWRDVDPASVVGRLERQLQRLPAELDRLRADREGARSEATRAWERLGRTWDQADELTALRRRQQEITEAMLPEGPADPSPERSRAGASIGAPGLG